MRNILKSGKTQGENLEKTMAKNLGYEVANLKTYDTKGKGRGCII